MYELFYKRRAISRGQWSISLQHTSHIPLWLARSFLSENVFCLDSEMNPCVCKPKQFRYTTPSYAHTCLYTLPSLIHTSLSLTPFKHSSFSSIHSSLFYTHIPLSHSFKHSLLTYWYHMHMLHTHHTELYEYCLNEGYADKNLIAKWKKVSPHGT